MKQKTINFLTQPFPFVSEAGRKWRIILGFGLFVMLFIVFFNGDAEGVDHPLVILGFGLITMSAMVINRFLLPWMIPRLFVEERWTVIREIVFHLWTLFLIAFGNLLFANWGGYFDFTLVEDSTGIEEALFHNQGPDIVLRVHLVPDRSGE